MSLLPFEAPAPATPRPAAGGGGLAVTTQGEGVETVRPLLVIYVHGTPAPQGSKHGRPIYRGRGANREFTGKVAQVESSKRLPSWREAVKESALAVLNMYGSSWQPLDEPLYVHTVYTFTRPRGHYRTGRFAHLLRDDAPAWPATKGNDIEKLDRGTRDALGDAGVYVNDGFVVHHESWKSYPDGHPDALHIPGAVIRVYRIAST